MLVANNIPGRSISCNGREYLFFSGTAYLGINANPGFTELLYDGLKIYGSNYGSSRNSNLRLAIYEMAESKFASFTGAEAAMTVSSGYLAGQLISGYFKNDGVCLYGPGTHPALLYDSNERYSGTFSDWTTNLPSLIKQVQGEVVNIFCNSLDPLFSITYDFNWVKNLITDKSINLVIDDSHGLGVTGDNGSGIYKQINCPENVRLIVISSLAKAMGIPGGVIMADKNTIKQLESSPFFSAASPIPPAYLHAYLYADEVYDLARRHLANNLADFEKLLEGIQGFRHIEGYPVFYTEADGLAPYLEKRSILISSFSYPSSHDPLITRIIVNAIHHHSDLVKLQQHLIEFFA